MSKIKRARMRGLLLATSAALALGCGAQAHAQTVVNVSSTQTGPVDYSASTSVDFNILSGGRWVPTGTSQFSSGADDLLIANGGRLDAGLESNLIPDPVVTIDFGGEADVVTNLGVLTISRIPTGPGTTLADVFDRFEATVVFANLETFANSGDIYLGTTNRDLTQSDRAFDDILSMPGTTFIGSGASRILLDANLNGIGQSSCSSSLRNADGDLPGADCVAIIGGETAGVTLININDVFSGDRGVYNPDGTVLIDVSGGTSAAGHFVLDPESDFYNPAHGGVIDKGLFIYPLVYDAENQQHKLVGLAGPNAMQLPLLAHAAQELWRVSTGSALDRQADLRTDMSDGLPGGVWLRAAAEFADRDVAQFVGAFGSEFAFDNSYDQDSYAISGGLDVLSFGDDAARFVVGLMAGYGHSEVRFDASPNQAQLDGWTGGVYASFMAGNLYVDGLVNANKLTLKYDVPALDLFPSGTILNSDLVSVGAQVETGWRVDLGGGLFVEPMANLSYVKSDFDELVIPADDPQRQRLGVEYDDPSSLRGGLGARLGLNQQYGDFRAQLYVLGRVWDEFDGEASALIHNDGPDAPVTDEFAGSGAEFGVGAHLFSIGGAVSGFANLGGKFGDDYSSVGASAGVRVTW